MYIPDNAKWCENCDNPFIPDDKTDRFCSEICREEFNRSYAYKQLVTDLNIKNTIKHIQLEKEKL
jgi:predicted nucleic acid-binding Zn ribbon protein